MTQRFSNGQCMHPTCTKATDRPYCGIHWRRLGLRLQNEWKRYLKMTRGGMLTPALADERKDLLKRSEEHFRKRMVGDWDIDKCKYCGAPIAFVRAEQGHMIATDKETVDTSLTHFGGSMKRHVCKPQETLTRTNRSI